MRLSVVCIRPENYFANVGHFPLIVLLLLKMVLKSNDITLYLPQICSKKDV